MPSKLLDKLLEFYNDDPHDPFNIYSLALEYSKVNAQEAKKYFSILLSTHSGYVPTYYHAAKLWLDTGNRDEALKIYEKGIDISRKANDSKALRELQSAYQELLYE